MGRRFGSLCLSIDKYTFIPNVLLAAQNVNTRGCKQILQRTEQKGCAMDRCLRPSVRLVSSLDHLATRDIEQGSHGCSHIPCIFKHTSIYALHYAKNRYSYCRPLYNGKCPSGDCSPNVGGPLVKGGCAKCCIDPGKCSACCPGNASTVPPLEPLFHDFGVDLFVGGHVHDYERMYDIWRGKTSRRTVDMRATTYITTGKE